MKRNLISDNIEDLVNCVNGYLIEDTIICVCYPGWKSLSPDTFNQCDIDNGENHTQTNSGVLISNNEEKKDDFVLKIILIFVFILCFLSAIICIILCLLKKWKNIKLIKQKIKYEKNKNKKMEYELSLKLENKENKISSNTSTINKSPECQNNDINYGYYKKDSISVNVNTHRKKNYYD